MQNLRTIAAAVGFICLVLGLVGGLQNSNTANLMTLGYVLLITGAIIIVGVLISSAIVEAGRK